MGKIIALDFGLKRTGIAITDEQQRIAMGLTTVESNNLISFLTVLTQKENICTIVLGYPKKMDGSPTHITQNVVFLKEVLEKQFPELKVIFYDERFTSKMAMRTIFASNLKKKQREDKKIVDKVSATIILQSFLSSL